MANLPLQKDDPAGRYLRTNARALWSKIWGIAKRLGRRILGERKYLFARAYGRVLLLHSKGRTFLFVHHMGKVGSSSIVRSLRALGLEQEMPIYWTNFLSQEGTRLLYELEEEGYGEWHKMPPNIRGHISKAWALNRYIFGDQLHPKRCKVVSMVRDPIATNVSGFFQNHEWWPRELRAECRNGSPGCIPELTRMFLTNYPHDVPITWFDMEMKPVFGVDVYSSDFPKRKGYKIFDGEFADVLLLKLESLDDCATEAFRTFLGVEGFTLLRANISSEKWYSVLYREFLKHLSLSQSYVEGMYDTIHTRHFYTEDEIDAFRAKWIRLSG